MKKNTASLKSKYTWLMLLAFAIALCVLASCSAGKDKEITSYDQFNEPGIKVGVGLNCPEEYLLEEQYPNLSVMQYYDTKLGFKDVADGRLDAFVYSRRQMELAIQEGTEGVRLLDENYTINRVAVGISPVTDIPDFTNKLNTFIAQIKEDGTLDEMYDRWVLKGEETMPNIPKAENPQYHLKVATAGTEPPFTYYVGTELNGYDIELAKRFASYCEQIDMPARTKYRIHFAFEELMQQLLLPGIDDPRIAVSVEYSSKEKKADMKVKYNGQHFDPADSDNELSYKVLKSMTSDMQYTFLEDDGYSNQIECIF